MLRVVLDGDGLVDEQHGHARLDPVRVPQPRVVENVTGQQ